MDSSSITTEEIDEIVPDTWKSLIPTILAQPNAHNFVGKNRDAAAGKTPTLPVRELTFRALFPYPPEDWNVIIFGQNPYPRLESATGIAMFDGQYKNWQGTLSPSLRNIIKNAAMTELPTGTVTKATKIDQLRKTLKENNVVEPVQWFESTLQDRCLWLNTALTTGGTQADSAHNKFWNPIIQDIVRQILDAKHSGKGKGIVVALWGNQAAKLRKMVNSINVYGVRIEFVESYNPAAQGDIFCNDSVFGAINKSLQKLKLEAIDWLPRVNGKRKTLPSSGDSSKKSKKGAEQETARISAFMDSTIELHQMLVDRIKDVKLESSLKVTGLLDGLEKETLVSFQEALSETSTSQSIVDTALKFAHSHITDVASIDQVAALHLYTMGSSFYGTLNKCLRDAIPQKVKPFFKFLRLFVDAMDTVRANVSSTSAKQILWRGVNVDLAPKYSTGTTITWWGVSSCTTRESVARGFMGGSGTIFQVKAQSGVSVKQFSAFQGEDEVVLPPGTSLRVMSCVKKGNISTIHLAVES